MTIKTPVGVNYPCLISIFNPITFFFLKEPYISKLEKVL